MANKIESFNSTEFDLVQVCTSTPVLAAKYDHDKKLIWDELDVSMISDMIDVESPVSKFLHVTPSPYVNMDSYSELFSHDFQTAWNQSLELTAHQQSSEGQSSVDSFDTVVDAVEDLTELNGYDCPCSFDSEHHGSFLTLTSVETDVIPAMTAVSTDNRQSANFLQGVKEMFLGGVRKLFKMPFKTSGVQKQALKGSPKSVKNIENDNFNETMKPQIEVCNIFVSLKSDTERRIYKSLYLLTAREFCDYLSVERTFQAGSTNGSDSGFQSSSDSVRRVLAKRVARMGQQLFYLRQYLVLPNLIQSVVDHSPNDVNDMDLSNGQVFSPEYESAKLERVYSELELIKMGRQGNKMDKIILLTQFEPAMEVVRDQLCEKGFFAEIISDDMTEMEYQFVISEFSCDPNGPDILLFLVPTLVRTKWNMNGVRFVFFLDNHWDPTMELEVYEQMCNASSPVTVKRFITRDTVEEAIDEIRENKLLRLNETHLQDPSFYHSLTKEEIFKLFGFSN